MKSAVRLACASSALLASTLQAASDSATEYYNIANADGNPVTFMFGEWWCMEGQSGDYALTLTAHYDDPWFYFGTDCNRTQLGGTDFEIELGFSLFGTGSGGTTAQFSYNVDLPYTIDTAELSTWSILGLTHTELESDPNASYTAWMQYGSGPHLPFSGKIGTVSLYWIYGYY
jgi:hypothetical protein